MADYELQQRADGWHVVSADSARRLGGPYGDKAEAAARLREVASDPEYEHVVAVRPWWGQLVAIENPAGTVRRWYDADGKETGSTTMLWDYGFLHGVPGSDDEHLDCYIGPDPDAPHVFIVSQLKAPDFTEYDEQKCLLGFADAGAAHEAWRAHRNDGDRAFHSIRSMPRAEFLARLRRRSTNKPIKASRMTDTVATLPSGKPITFDTLRRMWGGVLRFDAYTGGDGSKVRVGVWDRGHTFGEGEGGIKVKDGEEINFTEQSFRAFIDNWYARGGRLPLSRDHQSALGGQVAAPALGYYDALAIVRDGAVTYFKKLNASQAQQPDVAALKASVMKFATEQNPDPSPDGLWGYRCEVTPLGMDPKEGLPSYAGISPFFTMQGTDEQGRDIGPVILDWSVVNANFQAGCELTMGRVVPRGITFAMAGEAPQDAYGKRLAVGDDVRSIANGDFGEVVSVVDSEDVKVQWNDMRTTTIRGAALKKFSAAAPSVMSAALPDGRVLCDACGRFQALSGDVFAAHPFPDALAGEAARDGQCMGSGLAPQGMLAALPGYGLRMSRIMSTAESALHVPGPIGEDKPNMGAHAMAYKVGDRVEVQVYPDKWYPGVVHRVGGNTAGIGVTYTDGFDGKEYRADFDEDRGKVRKMSATSAHAMQVNVNRSGALVRNGMRVYCPNCGSANLAISGGHDGPAASSGGMPDATSTECLVCKWTGPAAALKMSATGAGVQTMAAVKVGDYIRDTDGTMLKVYADEGKWWGVEYHVPAGNWGPARTSTSPLPKDAVTKTANGTMADPHIVAYSAARMRAMAMSPQEVRVGDEYTDAQTTRSGFGTVIVTRIADGSVYFKDMLGRESQANAGTFREYFRSLKMSASPSGNGAVKMATPVQLPTDAQLGNMKAAKIAEVYRDYVQWVRSQPSSEQWQFGDMQRKLQAAFKVAQEQERLGMSAVTMSTPIVSDSTGQMFAPGERVQTPDGMGTVSVVQPDGSGGGTCDVTVNGAVKRYDCKRVKVMSATVQMRATVRFKPGIQSAKHDGESGIVVGVNRNADVWNPVTRSMQTGTALRVRWPDGSEQEYPADWLIEMSATGAGVQTMAQVGDLVICPWCEGQTRIVAGGAMEDHWMNKNGNGPCPGSGKTPEAAKADRNRPIAVPPRGWMSASGSATMMAADMNGSPLSVGDRVRNGKGQSGVVVQPASAGLNPDRSVTVKWDGEAGTSTYNGGRIVEQGIVKMSASGSATTMAKAYPGDRVRIVGGEHAGKEGTVKSNGRSDEGYWLIDVDGVPTPQTLPGSAVVKMSASGGVVAMAWRTGQQVQWRDGDGNVKRGWIQYVAPGESYLEVTTESGYGVRLDPVTTDVRPVGMSASNPARTFSRGTPIKALSGGRIVSGPVLFARGSDVFVQTPRGVVKASAKTAVKMAGIAPSSIHYNGKDCFPTGRTGIENGTGTRAVEYASKDGTERLWTTESGGAIYGTVKPNP